MPDADLLYPRGILHYARGMALANQGKIEPAKKEWRELDRIARVDSVKKITVWEINSATDLLNIAVSVLKGEIAFKQGRYQEAINAYQTAVNLEDNLNYNEPPDWFFSIRHPLGHVLLQAGNYPEAEKVFLKDLEEYKNNGWALMGLYQALSKQHKTAAANKALERYRQAWQYADQELKSSVIL